MRPSYIFLAFMIFVLAIACSNDSNENPSTTSDAGTSDAEDVKSKLDSSADGSPLDIMVDDDAGTNNCVWKNKTRLQNVPHDNRCFDGLAFNDIWAIETHPNGDVYIATSLGLSIFNPTTKKFKTKTVSDGLLSSTVRSLAITADGTVLTGHTRSGIAISSDKGDNFRPFVANDSLPNNYVGGGIAYDKDGNLFVGTNDGLGIFRTGVDTFTSHLSGRIFDLTISSSGSVYVIFSDGVATTNDGGTTFTTITDADIAGMPISIRDVITSPDGTLLLATNLGLYISKDDGASFTQKTTTNGLSSDSIFSIHVVSDNEFLVGTSNGVSVSEDGGESFTALMSDGLGSIETGQIHQSDENLYVGNAMGLSYLESNQTTFSHFTASGTYDPSTVNTVWVRENEDIVVGTEGLGGRGGIGISVDGGRSFTMSQVADDSLSGNQVRDIFISSTGTFYLATTVGLFISEDAGATFRSKTLENSGLADDNIKSVSFSANGILYAATSNGLSFSTDNGRSFQTKTTADGLGSDDTRDIFISADGTIYVATAVGVSISSDSGTSFVNHNDGMSGTSCLSVHVTPSGKILTTINANGVAISTDGGASFTMRTTAHGLPSNSVTTVSGAGEDQVFVGTLTGFAVSNDGGENFETFSKEQGLPHPFVNAFATNKSGEIYIGTAGGLAFKNIQK